MKAENKELIEQVMMAIYAKDKLDRIIEYIDKSGEETVSVSEIRKLLEEETILWE